MSCRTVQKICVLIVSLFSIYSCMTSNKVNYLQSPNSSVPRYDSITNVSEYKLINGDRLFIKISSFDKESKLIFNSGVSDGYGLTQGTSDLYSYTINSDSCIVFPYIGSIKLAGSTVRQAKSIIKDSLTSMIPDCDVDVKLVNSYFSIIGNAGVGKFQIQKEKLTIFQALAASGDLKTYSDRAKVFVIRQAGSGSTTYHFDLRSEDIIKSEYYYILPNDVIYVQSVKGQFFGISSFGALTSSIASTFSLAYLLINSSSYYK